MERQNKDARAITEESETGEESAPASSLSDFLAHGLRESQRPPAPIRESQRPAVPPLLESGAPASLSAEPARLESQIETVATPVEAAGPSIDATPDELLADRPSVRPQTVSVVEQDGESETDYVVPVGRPARPRIVAAAVTAGALIIVMVWWLLREQKAMVPPDLPRAASTSIAHEPLLPPPPSEEVEPNEGTEVDTGSESAKGSGSGAGPESASSAAPPGGPNVARYPDLPTHVLIQLEKDQEEAAKSK